MRCLELANSEGQKVGRWLAWAGGRDGTQLTGTESQFGKMKTFWSWTVAMAAQQMDCTQSHRAEHSETATTVNFTVCTFYHN